jgi:hypothetical protein
MRKIRHSAGLLTVVLAVGSAAATARAEDPVPYCRSYASAAINASRAARTHDACLYLIQQNPARWSQNYDGHFNFCMGAFGSGDNAREWQTRTDQLNGCIPGHRW